MSKVLIYVGSLLIIVGLVMHFVDFNWNWFGRLPGDIRIEKPGFTFFMPVTSMIILSVVVSLLIWLYRKFLG
ncbi:DUF2905 domain-containing protein [Olivibacter sp. XZL3]|uniref:DUF2905 domain-containing protein n=1 Tax=Olivibacter sp. XZL3 TaxID=1735116 RepID=UPI001064ED17|nr:DUF2905 domain-containing protein [Olivibacter sp. XZL3]